MKRTAATVIVFIFLCILSNHTIDYTVGKQIQNQPPYSLSFASIGAISLESRLDCWANLRTSSSEEQLRKYMQTIASTLEVEFDQDNVCMQSSADLLEAQYDISKNRTAYHLILQSDFKTKETHFIVSAETTDRTVRLETVKKRLDRILGLEWHDYYLFTGELNHFLDIPGCKQMAGVVLKNLQAKKIEEYREGWSYSTTGYSRELASWVRPVSGDEQLYNVQVAFHSSPSQSKTYVYIGFPLIVGNY